MGNKSTLGMIEHIVMLLVFALAAAVCLRMFGLSDTLSRKYETTDRAAVAAQNAAEMMKKNGLTWITEQPGVMHTKENTWAILYDENWEVSGVETMVYALVAKVSADTDEFLWKAELVVMTESGEELFRLPVAGQCVAEVTANEEV